MHVRSYSFFNTFVLHWRSCSPLRKKVSRLLVQAISRALLYPYLTFTDTYVLTSSICELLWIPAPSSLHSQLVFKMSYVIPGQGPSTHSHLVCSGCQTLLMYPAGAASVRCQRCNHITGAPPAVADSSQIVCNGCRVLLSYPRGADSVQCAVCQAVTQVPRFGHLVCGGCSIMLMYPVTASCVKCSVCHFVTAVSATGGPGSSQPGPSRASEKPTQTVVIENPPSLDEHGNEVTNIAVGVQKSDK